MFMLREDAADIRAYFNRRDYWAYGKEPDWKRRRRAEKEQAEREMTVLRKAKQAAAAGRWEDVPWELRKRIRTEQKRDEQRLADQERIAAEKRRAYVEQMRLKRKQALTHVSNAGTERIAVNDSMMTDNTRRQIEMLTCPECGNYIRAESEEAVRNGKTLRKCECPVCNAVILLD